MNRSTVTRWEKQGLLSMTPDGLVKVEESEWLLADRPATYRGGVTKGQAASTPKQPPAPTIDVDAGNRMTALYMLRPAAIIIASAVLEAGGSLEVAFAATRLAHSCLVEATQIALHVMQHPDFRDLDVAELRAPTDLCTEPDWAAFAAAAGKVHDAVALQAYLDANPVWDARGDDDPRRFTRDLTMADVTG